MREEPGRPEPLDRTGEWVNAATHAVGVVGALAVLPILVVLAARNGGPREIVAASVFGATLVLLYLASTLYHAARSPRVRARLRVLDHVAIYLLIAGSYTPFTIAALRGAWGWALFGVVWGLAALGVVFKLFFIGRFRRVSTLVYLAMGWLMLVAAVPLVQRLDSAAVMWLAAGGIAYTVGTPFYHWDRFRYSHAVWHGFVLAGSACHAVAVAVYL